jgi:uncharacterized protein (DUF302 family)
MQTLVLKLDTDTVAAHLIEAILAYPMGLVAHINGQMNAAKRGLNVPADQILEVFRPDFAVRVWQADKQAGIEIPLRIHLYAVGELTVVNYRRASDIFAPYANPALNALALELDAIFGVLLGSLSNTR